MTTKDEVKDFQEASAIATAYIEAFMIRLWEKEYSNIVPEDAFKLGYMVGKGHYSLPKNVMGECTKEIINIFDRMGIASDIERQIVLSNIIDYLQEHGTDEPT